ncbi:MAG: EF-P lysine aminoacylase GenX [Kiritimatiellaeota bacterium]|nr:EF-P lysine aminoacylase GenX [Kiritimatiellota bacterium]
MLSTLSLLRLRHTVWTATRSFLQDRGYVEVQTPVRISPPALEDFIDAEPCGDRFLRTSPEFHMKRLLAEGLPRLYQIGPCFRRGEFGPRHLPEFTMLEWYAAGTDYRALLAEAQEYLAWTAGRALGGEPSISRDGRAVDLKAPWEVVRVEEAFREYAGEDLARALEAGRFEEILISKIEPELGWGCPCALIDYPVEFAGFARVRPGPPPRAERWELYIAGIEIANACTELTDAAEQRRRMERSAALRARNGAPIYGVDEAFLQALEKGLPPAAGIAVGLDRLVMVLGGVEQIRDAVPE